MVSEYCVVWGTPQGALAVGLSVDVSTAGTGRREAKSLGCRCGSIARQREYCQKVGSKDFCFFLRKALYCTYLFKKVGFSRGGLIFLLTLYNSEQRISWVPHR